ncbi:pyrroline-5-carboxylate reductase [Anaerobacillus sp. MEB173]|uniref:pyrroline-5-carboxylate reductase n=1 Tax=Anaerobacillus sp. MEB173 TaxID=3383345 RepID=UPI003F9326FB
MFTNKRVAFIGGGSMAESIISGLLEHKLLNANQIVVTNRSNHSRLNELNKKYHIVATTNKQEALQKSDIVVLAMKPKDVVEGINLIREYTNENQLIVSVLAGISTEYLSDLLGHNAPVIRTMPNTSAAVGASATAIAPGKFATENHLQQVVSLFEAVGTATVVAEADLDAVTGLSGSGPAYIYYLAEAMEKAAEETGLEKGIAKELIVQTILGAAIRLQSSDEPTSVLYKQVMSPGGTTEAGFEVLKKYNFQEAMTECVKRATTRSKELGEILSNVSK